jgi:tetratricopeptide (TPR) repeat protein
LARASSIEVDLDEWSRFRLCILVSVLTFSVPVKAQDSQTQKLDREFQTAVADYDAGKYPEAEAALEGLLPYAAKSFEVHELLGLVYAAQAKDAMAVEQLEAAVRLKPDSATGRTNLAAALAHSGKSDLAGEQFVKALALAPQDYDANHNLGEFYIRSGKMTEARPLLEEAQRLHPDAYDNGYDLAQLYLLTGKFDEARHLAQSLLKQKNTGELHSLLGHVEEKDGKFLAAANEYELAAHLDPSEENLFDWGSEYLLHRTYDPAIDIFQQATLRYPGSPRLYVGLGMALYSRDKYEEAVKALLTAADLDPADSRCYLFLSKAYSSSPKQADEVIQRFRRYSEIEPKNALAQYYYAMSLWKGKRVEEDAKVDYDAVESLLERAIALDDKLPEAHLQLGILYADRHEYPKSLPEYERALQLNPNFPDVHYRLGQYYVHAGEKDKAQAEFDLYQKLQAQHMAEVDKERAEVRQFVYSAKAAPAAQP